MHKADHVYTRRFFYLFHALILMIILYPLVETRQDQQVPWVLILANTVIILTVIWTSCFKLHEFILGVCIGLPSILIYWFPWVPYADETLLLSRGLLFLYTIKMIFPHLMRANEIGPDEVFATTSIYILLGMTWTVIYEAIEHYVPGSFYLSTDLDRVLNWSDIVYFSFTTLTTLGYGDITPVNPFARSIAILEAITGILFIPVIVSGAMSLFLSSSWNKRHVEEVTAVVEKKILKDVNKQKKK
ncbi:MAG: two pore domain potassium channel family protein [Chlamydiia bacterium]|nr:two pore domain potassium channel family protein [Chlamydiia bacterium]